MTEQALLIYLREQYPTETEACEWKEFKNLRNSVSGQKKDDVISYVSALANMNGGYLVLGVADALSHITGIQEIHDYTPENLKLRLLGNCTNLNSEGLAVEEFITTDTQKRVWVIQIPKHRPRKPVYAHRTGFQRIGDSLIELTAEREESILREPLLMIEDWSSGICPEATLSDLDPVAIRQARENYRSKNQHLQAEVDTWDDITFLNKARLTIKGQITNTAILLLGLPESEYLIAPALARMTWILKGKDSIERDYEHFTCPFLLTVEQVFQKIRNLKYRYLPEGTLFPEEVFQYEPYNIRELLHNCIAHQDYTLSGRINIIEQEDGALIFTNMGKFIPGSVEQVITDNTPQEQHRNPLLVQVMVNLKMIDNIGSGIRRIFNNQRQRFFPLPDYDYPDNRVGVVLQGKILDLEYARMLALKPDLNLREIFLLDKVQKRKPLTDEEIRLLKEKRLIEGRKPLIHISSQVASQTGQQATYIKQKAFDDQHYKNLIVEFIRKFGPASRPRVEELLWNKLPEMLSEKQKKYKVGNLLSSLRMQGLIYNEGSDAKSSWALAKRN